MNKMIMAFASGKPIVCNAGLRYSEIREFDLGIDKAFADSQEYANVIKRIYEMPQAEFNAMCERVKDVAKSFDINFLCSKFEEYCEIS